MIAAVAMVVRGHSALTRDLAAQFAGQPQHHQAHAELGHRIGGVRREPFLLHVERRRQHQDVRVARLQQMREGVFRHHEGAARIDLMHQVEAAHVGLRDRRERDGAGIVDHDVDAAEMRRGLSIAAFTAASSRTSTASGSAPPPTLRSSPAAVWMVPSSLGCGSTVLAAIATLAPSAAALSAIASPMPREPPVMNRVLPLSDIRVLPSRRVVPGDGIFSQRGFASVMLSRLR